MGQQDQEHLDFYQQIQFGLLLYLQLQVMVEQEIVGLVLLEL
jgi:hypothetical protein